MFGLRNADRRIQIEFFYNLSQFLYLSLAINIWGPECSSCRLCGHPSSLPLSSEDSADVFSSSVTRRRQYYLFNSRLLRAIIICPIAFLVWQIRFNMFYKVLIDTQKWAECFKILQKWQNFVTSGHTARSAVVVLMPSIRTYIELVSVILKKKIHFQFRKS